MTTLLIIAAAAVLFIGYLLMTNRKLKNGLSIANERIKRQQGVIENAKTAQKNKHYVNNLTDDERNNQLHKYQRD